jgi:ankyrin repeat protein
MERHKAMGFRRPLQALGAGVVIAGLAACAASPADRKLLRAAYAGDDARVRAALSEGASADATQPDGRTALMLAAESGDVEAVRALLERGADPNAQAVYGETALMLADPDVVGILVEAGADVDARNGTGRTALISATDVDKVRALLAAGADVDRAGSDGATPLINAVTNRFPSAELVRVLLDAGADVNARDGSGRTALAKASRVGADPEILDLLREAGAVDTGAAPTMDWTDTDSVLSKYPASARRNMPAPAQTGLLVEVRSVTTDGRNAKISGRVTNALREPVHGIRYRVALMGPDGQRVLDEFEREIRTTVEPGAHSRITLDLQSMYFGASGGGRFVVQAFPIRVGGDGG